MLLQEAARVSGEEFHGEMDAFKVAAFDGQVARLSGAGAKHHGVKFLMEFGGGIIDPDLGLRKELDALGLHLADAAQQHLLLVEFHVGDAVHEQAAHAVGALEDGDPMAGAVELHGGAQTGGTGADDGHLLVGAGFRRLRHHPAFIPAPLDNACTRGS